MLWTHNCDDRVNSKILINFSLELSETFQRGSGWPFTTVYVKNLIFWGQCLFSGLFNYEHKPFISTVLVDANRLVTYAGHSFGWPE